MITMTFVLWEQMRAQLYTVLRLKCPCKKNGQLGPRLIILEISLTEAAKPELWTFLGLLHLPTGTVCNLLLVGPDHKEEVEAKHPAVDAEGDIREAGAGDGSYDVADVKEEPDTIWDDIRPHKADVPLRIQSYWYVINKILVNQYLSIVDK